MKKYGKRIAALALSMVIALGSVCYKPPKAEAAIIEGMVANMFLSAYMTASGISLVPDDATVERLGYALEDLIPDFVADYAAEVGEFTSEMFNSVIEQNCVIQTTGLLQIGHQAAALMGRFTGWLISKFGLLDADGVPVTDSVGVVAGNGNRIVTVGGTEVSLPSNVDYDSLPYAMLEYSYDDVWALSLTDKPHVYQYEKSGNWCFILAGPYKMQTIRIHNDTCTFDIYAVKEYGANSTNNAQVYTKRPFWSNYDIYDTSGALVFTGGNHSYTEDWENPALTVSLPADYASAPNVDEQYSMVIDTGLTYEDEETYISAVLDGVAAGTLSPTYTIEEATTGDVVAPDEDEEDGGILNWVKKIWQSVVDLPQTIANAIANVFVPSAEYMAALPETVTATFDNRTGFLTYPVSVLYDFADKLSAGSQDFILKWPTINEPYSGGQLMPAGQFNVSKYVRDNGFASDIYTIYQWVMGGYLTFLFFGLCRKKYNSVIGDRLGG